ncbi:predicted protein [Postia placenta Mad-698-R]|uniref:Uncharacterized protein n=1 Tax=Postia placenta MAD-698-R-SB12 TaxID=670580 RepID=A0A1X6N7P4_9APHY|nr:hypothetical protein POSPLADRAFT_1045540 [Postia placenta MAD-698-R-SB12]EED83769.1 predicted protein [Postia placenta Mad-698-R]OSX64510.1 hypothetical protein POSPLADRAFT_1045540 [Postia placenta MAD-698-R-SB12]
MSEHGEQMYRLSDKHPSIPKEEDRDAFVSTRNSSLASALYIPPKKAISQIVHAVRLPLEQGNGRLVVQIPQGPSLAFRKRSSPACSSQEETPILFTRPSNAQIHCKQQGIGENNSPREFYAVAVVEELRTEIQLKNIRRRRIRQSSNTVVSP